MIQRIQTVWLFFAALSGFLTTQVPVYAGKLADEKVTSYYASESLLLFALAMVGTLLGFIAIFLFKNRSTQIKFTLFGLLSSVLLTAVEVWEKADFEASTMFMKASYYWGSLFPIAMIVFFVLAIINIRKDNKLIKSLDRLR